MVALRSLLGLEDGADERGAALRKPSAADWLTLQQAACELDVSASTVRRMIQEGRLRHRIVPRKGGSTYLVYLPGSRHAAILAPETPEQDARADETPPPPRLVDAAPPGPWRDGPEDVHAQVRRLEARVEHLSQALSHALRIKQRSLPDGSGRAGVSASDPYARYRWLARRRRWWRF